MKKFFILVWVEEEEKWYYFKESFDETVFKDGYVDYYVEVDDNSIIISDSFQISNIGKVFSECYDLKQWEEREVIEQW